MNVNDKFQVDKQVLVLNFDKFYLLETKQTRKVFKENEKNVFLHQFVFDKYNK